MGTFLKYLFYIVLIVVIYLVGKGIFEGKITETTTVGQVVDNVATGTKELVKDGAQATENAVENYQQAPKKEVTVEVPNVNTTAPAAPSAVQ